MLERKIKINNLYHHFKGTYHRVVGIAKDSETLEEKVIYTHEDTGELWIRGKEEFLSFVDKTKYPEATQQYRFEEVKEKE